MKTGNMMTLIIFVLLSMCFVAYYQTQKLPMTTQCSHINTECIKGARYVIVDDKKIRLKKFDKNALNQVSDIYCVD